ncbi:MAG: hypothetical protein A2320_02255 [Pseudomonadales bacterium GWC2_63_15]|nr:MAG: hypothetical protein A2320_02255 [Pseudomonadales bacterium GWC2_63_15]
MTDGQEGESPFSPTGPTGDIPRTAESSDLLTKAGTGETLDPVAAEKARKKYRAQSSQDIGRLQANSVSSDMGFGNPGEADTDEEAPEDYSEEISHDGYQVIRPANAGQVEKQLQTKLKKSYTESTDPQDIEGEKDNWIGDSPTLTEADLPHFNANEHNREPKGDNSRIDMGRYDARMPSPNLESSASDLEKENQDRKLWRDPLVPELMDEPGFPEEIAKEELRLARKKGYVTEAREEEIKKRAREGR